MTSTPLRLQCLAIRHCPKLVPVNGAASAGVLGLIAGFELAHSVLELHQRTRHVFARLFSTAVHSRCPLVRLCYFRCRWERSEEHTSELQSLMRISYAVFC